MGTRHIPYEDLVEVKIPREAAELVAKTWELDLFANPPAGGEFDLQVILRDLFNGHDGHLHALNEALGRDH